MPRFTSASMLVSADAIAPSSPAFCAMVATTDDAVEPDVGVAPAAAVPLAVTSVVAEAAAAPDAGTVVSAARFASRRCFSCETSAARCLSLSSVAMMLSSERTMSASDMAGADAASGADAGAAGVISS